MPLSQISNVETLTTEKRALYKIPTVVIRRAWSILEVMAGGTLALRLIEARTMLI